MISYLEELDLNKGEALQDVRDKILDKSNDYIEEITGTAPPNDNNFLSKSGMELVFEAQTLTSASLTP